MKRCSKCGEEKVESEFWRKGDGLNSACRVCAAQAKRDRYNPEQARQMNQRYYQANREQVKSVNSRYYQAHKARYAEQNHDRYQHIKRTYKQAVFDYYGWRCACCGESIKTFLTIDHVNNDGAEHRRALSGSRGGKVGVWFYKWLAEQGFPVGYQTLCWNCNMGKHLNGGICPHQTLERSETIPEGSTP